MFELTGHRALVTGAGDGMGVGIAHALARQGAAVAVNDIVASKADATRDAILSAGGTAVERAVRHHRRNQLSTAGLPARRKPLGGHIDILVNNAGIPADMAPIRFRDLPPARWRSYIDINLYGSLHCIAAVIEPMVEARWGRIIQISSGAGRTGLKIGVSLYGASKSGIEGFIRHLSTEVASTGVTANALALGLMSSPNKPQDRQPSPRGSRSPFRSGASARRTTSELRSSSSPRMRCEWMTGQTINLNGGSTFS